jgi:peroxiredoxin
MKAYDFLGKEINIGDNVVFVQLSYRNLLKGIITKITPKTLIISHGRTNVCSKETKQFHNQVIKYNSESFS